MSRRSHSQYAPRSPEPAPSNGQPIGEHLRELAAEANEILMRMQHDARRLAEIKVRASHAVTAVGAAVKTGIEEEIDGFVDRISARIGRARQ